MSWPAVVASLWVLAATGVAFLPIRYQYKPGLALMICAPFIIVSLGMAYGWIVGLAGAAGFASMFRNPLKYFWRRLRGEKTEVPQ